MKKKLSFLLAVCAVSLILFGEAVEPPRNDSAPAGNTTKPKNNEPDIDQIIQSELENINGTTETPADGTAAATDTPSQDTGTTPSAGGEVSDGSKFKIYDNYENAIKSNPNATAIFRLCNLYYRDGLYQRALDLAKTDSSRNVRNLFVVAVSSRLEGDFDQSIQYYNEILAKYPNFPEAHLGLGIAYKSKGEFSKAAQYLRNYNNMRRDDNARRELALLEGIINGTY